MRDGAGLAVDESRGAPIVESPRASTVGLEERAGEDRAPLRVGYQLADAFSGKPRVWRHRTEEKHGGRHTAKLTRSCPPGAGRSDPTEPPAPATTKHARVLKSPRLDPLPRTLSEDRERSEGLVEAFAALA